MRILLLYLLLLSNILFSQNILKGFIKDNESKLGLSGANIFIANTSAATISDEKGYFEMEVNNSNAEIIVSYVGYETISFSIKSIQEFNTNKVLYLSKSNTKLNEVVINFTNIKNRESALKTFTYYFVGNSELASNVKLLNPDDIEFREQKESENYKLIAFSDKPIILINKKLGYKISYILVDFEYNHDNAHENLYAYYNGYAQFIDIIDEYKLNKEKVNNNRKNAYKGSLMHFIRSMYTNTYNEEGFKITKFKKVPNPLYNPNTKSEVTKTHDGFSMKHHHPKYTIVKSELGLNENLIVVEDGKKYLSFSDYIQVDFANKKEDYNYAVRYNKVRNKFQTSEIQLKDIKVEILPDGNYSPGDKIVFYGHMSWEKIGDMLPFDYQP